MRLFDGHIHIACEQFQPDFDAMLSRMEKNHVSGGIAICDPGDPMPDHEAALSIVHTYPRFHLSAACHPQNALHFSDSVKDTILRLLPECVCIGETGLDYYDNRSAKQQQIDALNWHLDLAHDMNLPVQLHVRNAHGDMLDILRDRKRRGCLPGFVMHCFTRSFDLAREYLRLGGYISLAGTVTFTNANKLLITAKNVPVDRLLIETDAPWVAPEPYRGQPGEPAFLLYTFEKIAALRGEEPEALADILYDNALSLWKI